nr:MAG TPA: hypothetical protein [Bacteriophage sp.]
MNHRMQNQQLKKNQEYAKLLAYHLHTRREFHYCK